MYHSPSVESLACCVLLLAVASGPAVAAEPERLLREARQAAGQGDSERAVRLTSDAIQMDATLAAAYYLRGRERFRLGRVEPAVDDFDRYIKLRPDAAPQQWERGIALYYAGRYRQGAQQFNLYQTYSATDVENSVWRFLCMVPTEGIATARRAMLPVENDRRIPMMQILDLYRGKRQPDDVLAAVNDGNPLPDELAKRQFYAYLYLGLYYEVTKEAKQAARYIRLAADKRYRSLPGVNRYMWDVARLHAARIAESAKQPQ